MDAMNLLKSIKVLYIEDEEKIRTHITQVLKYLTHDVCSASNGQEAIEKFAAFKPDIILTDLKMPEINGVEFIKKLRAKNTSIPIIVITAYTDKDDLIDLVQSRIHSYLIKPISSEKLLLALTDAVNTLVNEGKVHYEINENLFFDKNNSQLIYNDTYIPIGKKEFDILSLLTENSNRIISYEEIERKVWQDSVMTKGALKTLVNSLSKKVNQKFIMNVSQIGYKIILTKQKF